jgi:hypothetical protein
LTVRVPEWAGGLRLAGRIEDLAFERGLVAVEVTVGGEAPSSESESGSAQGQAGPGSGRFESHLKSLLSKATGMVLTVAWCRRSGGRL